MSKIPLSLVKDLYFKAEPKCIVNDAWTFENAFALEVMEKCCSAVSLESQILIKEAFGVYEHQLTIKNKYEELRKDMNESLNQIMNLQNLCKHPNLVVTPKSCDESLDDYRYKDWIEYQCPDCGKYWETDI